MADNQAVYPGNVGTAFTVATDDISGAMYQRFKITVGADGVNDGDVCLTNPLPARIMLGTVAISAGAGVVGTGVPRMTLASDDPAVASLAIIDDWDETDRCKVNVIAGQIGIAGGTGVDGATVPRVTLATNVALPAGTNAIGKLAANSGVDIGDVDVTSVPADPFGVNADAASATGSISAKLRFIASTGIPVTGTVTVGSHAVTNAGTFVVQESGAALTALQLIDNIVSGAGVNITQLNGVNVTMGNGVSGTGVQRVTLASDSTGVVQDIPATSGGLTMHKTISAATTNATSVKASAGQVYSIQCSNVNAAARYLKLYNKASAPTVGSDTPTKTLIVPGNSAGAGFVINWDKGLAFATGIAFALTTEATDAGTTAVAANELTVNIDYK